jgi:hypothetical protein
MKRILVTRKLRNSSGQTRWRVRIALASVAFAGLFLGGCGGGGSTSPPSPNSTPLAWDQGNWDQVVWQ